MSVPRYGRKYKSNRYEAVHAADMAANPHAMVVQCEKCEYTDIDIRRKLYRAGQMLCPKCGSPIGAVMPERPAEPEKRKCSMCQKTLSKFNNADTCYVCTGKENRERLRNGIR